MSRLVLVAEGTYSKGKCLGAGRIAARGEGYRHASAAAEMTL